MKLKAHQRRGQTIIEGILIMSWVGVFLGMMYYLSTVFEVSQKQTMLLRAQAFIELGNYSYFGGGEHGKDDPKDEKSQVRFLLGEKSSYVKVDIEKIKKWTDATKGELELTTTGGIRFPIRQESLTTTTSTRSDNYWSSFRFPKGLVFFEFQDEHEFSDRVYAVAGERKTDRDEPPRHQLFETLYIAHNRSIDLEKSTNSDEWKKTGMFSGGIHFNDLSRISQLKAEIGEGLVDNVDSINRRLFELVKADSSLSDEAEELEKNLNVMESLSGGAVAALISTAISTVVHFGLEYLGGALGSGASEAGSAAGSAGGQSAWDQMINQFKSEALGNTLGGEFLSGIFDAVTSPVRMAVNGVAGVASGLSGISGAAASGVTAGQSLIQISSGLSQLGQTAQFGMALGGQNSQGLNIAVSALALPGAVAAGIAKIDSGLNYNPSLANSSLGTPDVVGPVSGMNVSTQIMTGSAANGINLAEVVGGVAQITSAVGNLLVQIAPDLGQAVHMVNATMGVLSAASNLPGAVGNLADAQTAAQVLQATGQLAMGVGQLASGVATLAGKEDKVGAILQMAGGTMMMAGSAVDLLVKLKAEGIDIGNPLAAVGGIVESNIDGLKNSVNNFKTEMANATLTINNSFATLFGIHKTGEGNELTKLTAELGNKAQGSASTDKLSDALSTVNLQKDIEIMDELQAKMKAQYAITYAGNPEELAKKLEELDQKFDMAKFALEAQSNVLKGDLKPEDPAYKAVFGEGVRALQALNNEFDAKYKKDELGLAQIKGMMYDNDQWQLAQNLISEGKINEHAKVVEEQANKELGPLGGLLSATQGGARTNKEYLERIEQINSLLATKEAKEKLETKEAVAQDKLDRAMDAVQIAQSIPTMGSLGEKETEANKYRSVFFTQPVEQVAESATAAKSLVEDVLRDYESGFVRLSEFQITQLNAGKEKLARIIDEAKGKQYDTPREAFDKLRGEIYAREARFQETKARLIACQDGEC